MIEEQLKAFDSAIESARLLGRAESRKERGSYTEDDARFEVSMHQSIAKHRAAMLASAPPAPQQIGQGVPDVGQFINLLVSDAFRKGELWERCQGKFWPEAESNEFTKLRDKTIPDAIASLQQAIASTHQAPQQKPLTDEQDRALCEAYCNAASDEYFKARPQLDSSANRRIFYAGHRKAWIEWQAAHNIGEKK